MWATAGNLRVPWGYTQTVITLYIVKKKITVPVRRRAEIIITPPPPSQVNGDKLINRLDVYFL